MMAPAVDEIGLHLEEASNDNDERRLRRDISMMEELRDRIEDVRSVTNDGDRCFCGTSPRSQRDGAWSPLHSTPCASEQAAAAAIVAPVFSNGLDDKEAVVHLCQFSFRRWVLSTVGAGVLITCGLMLLLLLTSTSRMTRAGNCMCEEALNQQNVTVDQLVDENVTAASFRSTLRSMSEVVEDVIKAPASRSTSALWGSMRAARSLNASWEGRRPEQRKRMAYRAWVEMGRQWKLTESSRPETEAYPDALLVSYLSGEVSGCEVGSSCVASRDWWPSPEWCREHGNPAVSILDAAGSVNGTSVLVREYVENNDFDKRAFRATEQTVPGVLPHWRQDRSAAHRMEPMWSEVYTSHFKKELAVSWTVPLAFCSNLSCLEGFLAAEMSLPRVGKGCKNSWTELKDLLAQPEYKFPIGSDNSTLFVVQAAGPSANDIGQLIGTSTGITGGKFKAKSALEDMVKATARAVHSKFGAWNADELHNEQLFNFSKNHALNGEGRYVPCPPEGNASNDCVQAGTLMVELDKYTKWLIVLGLPDGAFHEQANIAKDLKKWRVAQHKEEHLREVQTAISSSIGVTIVVAAIGMGLSLGLSCLVTKNLERLGNLMKRFAKLDWGSQSAELDTLRSSASQTNIQDIIELENAFCTLVRGIEAFSKFVPGTVVTRVLHGDRRARRPRVGRLDVTVMFTSIGNFDSVSKQLTEEQLMQVMKSYHNIMTRVVEYYKGTIAEILDDGLLVYFNTPDPVVYHAATACECALAQQQAMELINSQLADMGLPSLTAHIGIHTGNVLSGIIGTDRKMKFGCMGDSVNLASRIKGCCKFYNVGIICSGATYGSLPKDRPVCRKLDIVKVKGRREPTPIYEIVGLGLSCEPRSVDARTGSPQVFPGRVCSCCSSGEGSRSIHRHASPTTHPTSCEQSSNSPAAAISAEPATATTSRPTVVGGSRPPAAAGDRAPAPVSAGEEDFDEDLEKGSSRKTNGSKKSRSKVPLQLTCIASRLKEIHSSGRRTTLKPPGENASETSLSPEARVVARSTTNPESGGVRVLGGSGSPSTSQRCVTPERHAGVLRYEEALGLFQQARFAEAHAASASLLEEFPEDVPTQKLYHRATVALDGADGDLTEDQLHDKVVTRLDHK